MEKLVALMESPELVGETEQKVSPFAIVTSFKCILKSFELGFSERHMQVFIPFNQQITNKSVGYVSYKTYDNLQGCLPAI